MEILRVQPYNTNAEITVTDASTSYTYTIEDMADRSITTGSATSGVDSKISIPLSSRYDNQYLITVDNKEVFADVVRPYVDPNVKGTTASEITEYSRNEEVARAVIDSVISQGFYYQKKTIEITGTGADYIPFWQDVRKILKVYENNVLVYDAASPELYARSFEISPDSTAMIESAPGLINRSESSPLVLPAGASDWLDAKYEFRGFPKTFDYVLVLEIGNIEVPSDIVRAAEFLIDDISCGKLDYSSRYVSEYNTDQFKLKFDKRVFEGTGNIVVDKILSKYAKSIRTLGVL